MASTSCGNRLFVAWTGHSSFEPHKEHAGLFNELTEGHIAEYTIDASGKAALVGDTMIQYCAEMGGITISRDCAVLAYLMFYI